MDRRHHIKEQRGVLIPSLPRQGLENGMASYLAVYQQPHGGIITLDAMAEMNLVICPWASSASAYLLLWRVGLSAAAKNYQRTANIDIEN